MASRMSPPTAADYYGRVKHHQLAGRTFAGLAAVIILFQAALVAGAPWGELTMGGAYPGTLPFRMRIAAIGSGFLLAAMSGVVAARAGIALPRWRPASRRLIWVVVAYCALAVVVHIITPSPRERALWLPVVMVMAICALVVARSSAPDDA